MNVLYVIAVVFAIMGTVLFLWQQNKEALKIELMKKPHLKGRYIGPLSMLFIRWLMSFLAAFIIVGTFYLPIVTLSYSVSFANSWQIATILILIITALFGLPDAKLIVPINTVAPQTFFKSLKRLYLLEGEYNWWAAKFFFGRSMITHRDFTTRLKDSEPGKPPMEDGFFKITRIPFVLWESVASRTSMISATAKSGSKLQAEFLITLESTDPYLVLRNDNPGLEIAERARSAFRTAISYFTSMDVALMKDVISLLIEGKVIVVAFLHKQVGDQPPNSVVRDAGGEPLYRIVEVKDSETLKQATDRTILEYGKYLDTVLPTATKQAISRKPKGGARIWGIETREVATSLNEILTINGLKLVSASVGTVILDDRLTQAAVTAEQQNFEGSVQVKSAMATAAALKKLEPSETDRNDPTYADRLAIAAAADPGATNITFARVSAGGGNPFVEAAAVMVGASKNKEGKKE
jgi:hypothetical protein